eukprot:CAMPEP_0194072528 /NCGR_PEP_ID=MMETSP0149-20130528/254_1 /TAXON_ID=122233 /ORGANISM="Chaetoceros debilis, Strain MM31A-1" /LENGTH=77 /DNA_ID=CAMNT_0038752421 /DNA_START=48 /DNA_END=281 /DNA_ORIENTATION=-
MKGSIAAFAALALSTSASAFVPATPAFSRVATSVNAEEKKELVLDTNFEDVNVARLLGLKKIKKKIRKMKGKAEKEN